MITKKEYKIIGCNKTDYIGINQESFILEFDEDLGIPVVGEVNEKYPVRIWERSLGEGYKYLCSYMTADSTSFIPEVPTKLTVTEYGN